MNDSIFFDPSVNPPAFGRTTQIGDLVTIDALDAPYISRVIDAGYGDTTLQFVCTVAEWRQQHATDLLNAPFDPSADDAQDDAEYRLTALDAVAEWFDTCRAAQLRGEFDILSKEDVQDWGCCPVAHTPVSGSTLEYHGIEFALAVLEDRPNDALNHLHAIAQAVPVA